MSKKYMFINLVAQGIAFGVSFIISFFVTPRIVEVVGKETYGYLGLANNFAGYVTVITVALNALAGRFVSISIHKNNSKDANEYFNSVMISNAMIAAILTVPAVLFVMNLERFFEIPMETSTDIKLTFSFVFLSFFINLICSIFSVATFAKNKVYLASIRSVESNLLRIAIIIICFVFFKPRISYISGALLVANVFVAYTNYMYTKKLLPEIRISKKFYSIKKVKELIVSGCWNSITALSNMLLEGLDLLISNLLLGAQAMGVVAIVKSVPNMLYQAMNSIVSVFLPQLTIDYAKEQKSAMVGYISYASKIVGLLMAIPVSFIIVFGKRFYSLWMPYENENVLWILSILSLSELIFAGSVNIMYNLFHVTNKLKAPAIATLITGVLNTTIVLMLLKTTDLGVYAVVSVSSLLGVLRHMVFNIPYSAQCINIKKWVFYKTAFRSVAMVLISCVIGTCVEKILHANTWINLIICAVIMSILSIILNVLIFYSKDEKKNFLTILEAKLIKKTS